MRRPASGAAPLLRVLHNHSLKCLTQPFDNHAVQNHASRRLKSPETDIFYRN